jgi:hypothetical protein
MSKVEFPDGHRISLASSVKAENICAQVLDPEAIGAWRCLTNNIVAHQTNGKQVLKEDGHVIKHSNKALERW